ncbi:polycystin-1-like protein 1 [Pseudochaenichthys georgianus]|uniref:polycystin-1-like protein 1 n=1 Tax=Pseudochaenichthys georgianus TaxID=52239 RepID=UPI00146C2C03|nr:polycystic kidney disease 1 like 1-like [Pseudochaenichthys georgianus]
MSYRMSAAASKLKLLQSDGWLDGHTVSLHFTLFSPAPHLFTSVSLHTEQSPPAGLLPSARVQSVGGCHSPAVGEYGVMVCQLLFLVLSLLQLCYQVYAVGEQGLMGYWRTPCNRLECIRSLRGVTLFLLTMKSVTALRVNSSDSLHQTLPSKAHRYPEDSPALSHTQEINMHAQVRA